MGLVWMAWHHVSVSTSLLPVMSKPWVVCTHVSMLESLPIIPKIYYDSLVPKRCSLSDFIVWNKM